jgi:hypothetical protein
MGDRGGQFGQREVDDLVVFMLFIFFFPLWNISWME